MKVKRALPFAVVFLAANFLFGLNPISAAETKASGFLGVVLKNLDEETRESLKFKESAGVLVDDVVDESPADEAGLEEGDIILSFNGQPAVDEAGLRELIKQTKPGDQAALVVFRDQEKKNFKAKMGEASDFPTAAFWDDYPLKMALRHRGGACCESSCQHGYLGIEVQRLSDQLADYFKVEDGLLISTVIKDSPAQKAGIKAGDVVVKIGEREIEARSDLRLGLCGKKAGDEVPVEIIRGGKKQSLKVTLGEPPAQDKSCKIKMKSKCCEEGEAVGKYREGMRLFREELSPDKFLGKFREFEIELDEPLEELQQQLDELRQELKELQLKLEKK